MKKSSISVGFTINYTLWINSSDTGVCNSASYRSSEGEFLVRRHGRIGVTHSQTSRDHMDYV